MRSIIVSTSYVKDYKRMLLVELWGKLTKKLNPDTDIVVFDSASPMDPTPVLEPLGITVHRFPENVGHYSINGVDGWGRAYTTALDYAVDRGYDYVNYCDSDILFNTPIDGILDRMRHANVVAACPMDPVHLFIENGLMFFKCQYLKDSEFTSKYNWEEPDGNIPEYRCEKLLADVLFTLPLKGLRNTNGTLTAHGLFHGFAYGMHYLTHCDDFSLYHLFLRRSQIEL